MDQSAARSGIVSQRAKRKDDAGFAALAWRKNYRLPPPITVRGA